MALQRRPALYEQLAAELRTAINAGDYPPGELLPSEAALAARYEVSRPTVRQALAQLRSEGLVLSRTGKGSYVRGHAAPADATTLARRIEIDPDTGHHSSADARGWSPVEAPSQYRINADAELAALLGVDEHHPCFVRDRLLADDTGRRMAARVVVPYKACEGTPLEDDPWRDPDELYDLFARARRAARWREYTSARMPTPDETAALQLPDATPILSITRVTLDQADTPVMAEQTTLSADGIRLAHELTASEASASPQAHHRTTASPHSANQHPVPRT